MTVDFVTRTKGLDYPDKKKLNLVGPFLLPEGGEMKI